MSEAHRIHGKRTEADDLILSLRVRLAVSQALNDLYRQENEELRADIASLLEEGIEG